MSTEYNFRALRKVFTHKRIKYILSSYIILNPDDQVDISTVWQRKYNTLADLLNRTGYNGDLIGEHIINHFNVYAHDKINKQVDKRADDELFNKLREFLIK